MEAAFFVAFWIAAGVWAGLSVLGIVGHFSLRDLPKESDAPGDVSPGDVSPGAVPGPVSVIIPTRDEGERLARTVRSVLAQRDVEIELIVIDDRSSDGTSDILAEIAEEDARLTVIRVDEVPHGWLGKCHACHLGAQRARGDFLLFMDADAWIAEDVIARALRRIAVDGADHMCLVPGLGECTFVGKAAVSMITLGLLGIAAGVNRDFRWSYVGVGAFSLYRREMYERIGGHTRVRLEVVEDFTMGWHVRCAGGRTRLYAAIPDFEVRWAHSAGSFVQVLEKNLFAKMKFNVARAAFSVTSILIGWALPLVGVVVATPAGLAAAGGMAACTVPAMWMARRHGWSLLPGLVAPLTLPILAVASANSTLRVLRQGGIRWRETFYPLAELRAALSEVDEAPRRT